MSNNQKSTALYPHPFSRAYWRDAAAELKDTHMLVFAALMIALRLVMKQVSIPITPTLRINTGYFVNAFPSSIWVSSPSLPSAPRSRTCWATSSVPTVSTFSPSF